MTDMHLAHEIAVRAHRDQTNRAGEPYISHPLDVASRVDGKTAKVVALLHDVPENTSVDLASVRALFGSEIADAVQLLTHEDGVSYEEYIRAIPSNPLAKAVKLADLESNIALCSREEILEQCTESLRKYNWARNVLLEQNGSDA